MDNEAEFFRVGVVMFCILYIFIVLVLFLVEFWGLVCNVLFIIYRVIFVFVLYLFGLFNLLYFSYNKKLCLFG